MNVKHLQKRRTVAVAIVTNKQTTVVVKMRGDAKKNVRDKKHFFFRV